MATDQLLTAKQVAGLLRISVQTLAVWRCERRYDLRYIKIGASVRYKRSDVDRFVEEGASSADSSRSATAR